MEFFLFSIIYFALFFEVFYLLRIIKRLIKSILEKDFIIESAKSREESYKKEIREQVRRLERMKRGDSD